MNNNDYRNPLFQQNFSENMQNAGDQKPQSNAVYSVNIDLAEVLRVYSEGMVTAYNLGLMERNMKNQDDNR